MSGLESCTARTRSSGNNIIFALSILLMKNIDRVKKRFVMEGLDNALKQQAFFFRGASKVFSCKMMHILRSFHVISTVIPCVTVLLIVSPAT
ncbi:MAG: hypothetical protein E4G94_00210 [ANME-2 cluster archaeon]|nr:MAG: hypothetical protein E4G94_00210 [ANME-2 cluster archaeon]